LLILRSAEIRHLQQVHGMIERNAKLKARRQPR
jgi:hypothetical protein